MTKKLMISSSGYEYSNYEKAKRHIFHKGFSSCGFNVGFFDWRSFSDGGVALENLDGTRVIREDVDSSDIVYISAMGPIEGRESQLVDFIRGMGKSKSFVVNNPKTMEENLDKRYLLYLQEKGVAVVPTVEVGCKNLYELEDVLKSDDLVLKPRIFGERGKGVVRANDLSGDEFKEYNKKYGNVLAQPFLKGIIESGEGSYVFVGDEFSHGIYRNRVEWKYSGVVKRKMIEPSKKEMNIIRDVLSVWPSKYHVSRFDFITDKGKPMISEVEMINPNVWVGRGISEVDSVFVKRMSDYFR